MQGNTKLGAIGDSSSVLALKALGMYVISTSNVEETSKAIFNMYKAGINVIFITEKEAEEARETIENYRNDYKLSIIPIPSSSGSINYGMNGIKKNVEKALGADIIFNDR